MAENHRLLMDDFAPGDGVDRLAELGQVHGSDVVVVGPEGPGHDVHGHLHGIGDGLVTAEPGVTLSVRAADCVPVLFADREAGVIGACHCGRPGIVAGIVPATLAAMRDLGASAISAWIGPHVCGRCYEVPQTMQDEVADVEPAARATTSWGTPALDVGAGVRAQLEREAVDVVDVSRCTIESPDLYSYRREGRRSGRQAGLIRRTHDAS
jgi:YfiH family protein